MVILTRTQSSSKMKLTPIKLLWVALASLLVCSCGHVAQMQNPGQYSKSITGPGVKPLHIGKVIPTRHGAYHVQVYERSVIFMATTRLISPTQVEVYDLDHNNSFDVTYILEQGIWSIGFTEEFRSMNKAVPNSLSKKEIAYWIFEATEMKKSVKTSAPKMVSKKTTHPAPKKVSSPQPAITPKQEVTPPQKAVPLAVVEKEESLKIKKTPEPNLGEDVDVPTLHLRKLEWIDPLAVNPE